MPGDVGSLAGRLAVADVGSRVPVRALVDAHGGDVPQRLAGALPGDVSKSTNDSSLVAVAERVAAAAAGVSYRPGSRGTAAAWSELLGAAAEALGGAAPRDAVYGAADEAASVLLAPGRGDAERRAALAEIFGPLDADAFSRLAAIARRLTDHGAAGHAPPVADLPYAADGDAPDLEDADAPDLERGDAPHRPDVLDLRRVARAVAAAEAARAAGVCVPADAERTALPGGGERVRVPPAVRAGVPGPCASLDALPAWTRPAFPPGTESLNAMQTAVLPAAFGGDGGLVVCAPTGAGKTTVALLALLRHVGLQRGLISGGMAVPPGAKAVYIAPMRALVSEVAGNMRARLGPLGISVAELTGDSPADAETLRGAGLVVATPEKWDVVTRKAPEETRGAAALSCVCLLIVDEVHLLGDSSRGPVLEAAVVRARMSHACRVVALSATLPNADDVARFVGASRAHVFGAAHRPVPLGLTVVRVAERRAAARMRLLDEHAADAVLDALAGGARRQALVFVHARRETLRFARFLVERAVSLDRLSVLVPVSSGFEAGGSQISSMDLEAAGVGVHHAGLARDARQAAESSFASGRLRVLVCTATLAWGVNLPAHTVVVRGTSVYVDGSWAELPATALLQMLGRAGRPQYDVCGEGVVLTAGGRDALLRLVSLATAQAPVESRLAGRAAEVLLAEVVLGRVRSLADALAYMQCTFFAARVSSEPSAYGVDSLLADLRRARGDTGEDRDSDFESGDPTGVDEDHLIAEGVNGKRTIDAASRKDTNSVNEGQMDARKGKELIDATWRNDTGSVNEGQKGAKKRRKDETTRFLQEVAHSALAELAAGRMAQYREDARDPLRSAVLPTALGRIAAHYYVAPGAVRAAEARLGPFACEADVLAAFAAAPDFAALAVRAEERVELSRISERAPFPVLEEDASAAAKASLLLQAAVARQPLGLHALAADAALVALSAPRVLRALLALCVHRRWAQPARAALALCRCAAARLWPAQSPLWQLVSTEGDADAVGRLERRALSLAELRGMDAAALGEAVRSPAAGEALHRLVSAFPHVSLAVSAAPVCRELATVDVSVSVAGGETHVLWLFAVAEASDGSDAIVACARLAVRGTARLPLPAVLSGGAAAVVHVWALSDTLLGADAHGAVLLRGRLSAERLFRHPVLSAVATSGLKLDSVTGIGTSGGVISNDISETKVKRSIGHAADDGGATANAGSLTAASSNSPNAADDELARLAIDDPQTMQALCAILRVGDRSDLPSDSRETLCNIAAAAYYARGNAAVCGAHADAAAALAIARALSKGHSVAYVTCHGAERQSILRERLLHLFSTPVPVVGAAEMRDVCAADVLIVEDLQCAADSPIVELAVSLHAGRVVLVQHAPLWGDGRDVSSWLATDAVLCAAGGAPAELVEDTELAGSSVVGRLGGVSWEDVWSLDWRGQDVVCVLSGRDDTAHVSAALGYLLTCAARVRLAVDEESRDLGALLVDARAGTPVESAVGTNVNESLLFLIATGRVTTAGQAVDVLADTLLPRRLVRNPLRYGTAVSVSEALSATVDAALRDLVDAGMISPADSDGDGKLSDSTSYTTTPSGAVAAAHCVRTGTAEMGVLTLEAALRRGTVLGMRAALEMASAAAELEDLFVDGGQLSLFADSGLKLLDQNTLDSVSGAYGESTGREETAPSLPQHALPTSTGETVHEELAGLARRVPYRLPAGALCAGRPLASLLLQAAVARLPVSLALQKLQHRAVAGAMRTLQFLADLVLVLLPGEVQPVRVLKAHMALLSGHQRLCARLLEADSALVQLCAGDASEVRRRLGALPNYQSTTMYDVDADLLRVLFDAKAERRHAAGVVNAFPVLEVLESPVLQSDPRGFSVRLAVRVDASRVHPWRLIVVAGDGVLGAVRCADWAPGERHEASVRCAAPAAGVDVRLRVLCEDVVGADQEHPVAIL